MSPRWRPWIRSSAPTPAATLSSERIASIGTGLPSSMNRNPRTSPYAARAMDLGEQREAIAEACRRLAAEGLVLGTAGNVSARVGEHVLMTATGCVFAKAEPEHVTVVDLDGEL